MGISLAWPSDKKALLGLAIKYKLDKNSTVQLKANNLGKINLAYSNQIRNGVKLALSTLLDASNLNGGHHKVGLGLELNFKV